MKQQDIKALAAGIALVCVGMILGMVITAQASKPMQRKTEKLIQSSINLINLIDEDLDDFEDIYGETDEYRTYQEMKSWYYGDSGYCPED